MVPASFPTVSADAVTFEFVRTTREFFPQLQRWLREPHVARFWNHDTADDDIERDFGGSIDGTEPCEDFLVLRDGLPFGFIQRYRIADYPEDLALLAALVEIPPGSISIDYYVGDAQHTGQGLGTAMISAFVAKCRADLPDATAIVVPVVVPNRRRGARSRKPASAVWARATSHRTTRSTTLPLHQQARSEREPADSPGVARTLSAPATRAAPEPPTEPAGEVARRRERQHVGDLGETQAGIRDHPFGEFDAGRVEDGRERLPTLARRRCTVRRSTPRLRATCSTEQRPVGSSSSISSRTRLTIVTSSDGSQDSRSCWV